jgi:hypothetical protein
VPSRPYFHGGEEFYLHDGALVAYRAPFHNMHGVAVVGIAKVLTTDRRYELGHLLISHDGAVDGCVWGDSRRDRRYGLRSLEQLIQSCREVYGPRPRYAIDPPKEAP